MDKLGSNSINSNMASEPSKFYISRKPDRHVKFNHPLDVDALRKYASQVSKKWLWQTGSLRCVDIMAYQTMCQLSNFNIVYS